MPRAPMVAHGAVFTPVWIPISLAFFFSIMRLYFLNGMRPCCAKTAGDKKTSQKARLLLKFNVNYA
jgi:hypothetical protein